MSAALKIELRPLTHKHTAAFCRLVIALAEFEKLLKHVWSKTLWAQGRASRSGWRL